jgi:hypothetical protein
MQNQMSPNRMVGPERASRHMIEGFVDATEYRNRFKQ